jgi:hypothetical protein
MIIWFAVSGLIILKINELYSFWSNIIFFNYTTREILSLGYSSWFSLQSSVIALIYSLVFIFFTRTLYINTGNVVKITSAVGATARSQSLFISRVRRMFSNRIARKRSLFNNLYIAIISFIAALSSLAFITDRIFYILLFIIISLSCWPLIVTFNSLRLVSML